MPYSRIVLFTSGLEGQDGGIQRVTRSAYQALVLDTMQSYIFSSNDRQPLQTPPRQILIHAFGRHYDRLLLSALFGRMKGMSISSIYCYHLSLSPIAAIMARRFGCEFDVFLHGIEAWGDLKKTVKWALKHARRFVSNSSYTSGCFQRKHPEYSNKKSLILPLGLNAEFVDAVDALPQRVNSDSPHFLTVARFEESYKGEETLFEAFRLLLKRFHNARLTCVGDGPMRTHWMKYIQGYKMSDCVDFPGRVPDRQLAELYSNCTGFILLSTGEGFGIVYLEAMYLKKPCISTNADAAQEIVRNGENGFTVNPGDAVAAAQAMIQLIENPDLRVQMGEAGHEVVKKNFMPEHFQKRLLDWMSS